MSRISKQGKKLRQAIFRDWLRQNKVVKVWNSCTFYESSISQAYVFQISVVS